MASRASWKPAVIGPASSGPPNSEMSAPAAKISSPPVTTTARADRRSARRRPRAARRSSARDRALTFPLAQGDDGDAVVAPLEGEELRHAASLAHARSVFATGPIGPARTDDAGPGGPARHRRGCGPVRAHVRASTASPRRRQARALGVPAASSYASLATARERPAVPGRARAGARRDVPRPGDGGRVRRRRRRRSATARRPAARARRLRPTTTSSTSSARPRCQRRSTAPRRRPSTGTPVTSDAHVGAVDGHPDVHRRRARCPCSRRVAGDRAAPPGLRQRRSGLGARPVDELHRGHRPWRRHGRAGPASPGVLLGEPSSCTARRW